jgi:hypothetical protein
MVEVAEGSILLACLIGEIRKTDLEGIYRFEHRMISEAEFGVYKNYLTKRLEYSAWSSSLGFKFEPVSDITPVQDGGGFNVLVRPKP